MYWILRQYLRKLCTHLGCQFLARIPNKSTRPLPPYYTPRYVEVHSQILSCIWLSLGVAITFFGLVVSFLCGHNYVERVDPDVEMKFWHDNAVDGEWWYDLNGKPPSSYCNQNYTAAYARGARWGSDRISCLREPYDQTQIFYGKADEMRIAFSIAECEDVHSDGFCEPEYNTSNVKIYEGIPKSTVTFEPIIFTDYEPRGQYIPHCEAVDIHGRPISNRYADIHPNRDYGDGYLQLSVEDIVSAAGRSLDEVGSGSEGATLQLSGLVIMAHFRISNYQFSLNPFSFLSAGTKQCKVDFHVLREEFTVVHTFYDKKVPFAVQHGLRLRFRGSGSVGYVSGAVIFSAIIQALLLFGIAQTILDMAWYYFHPEGKEGKLEELAYTKFFLDDYLEGDRDSLTSEMLKHDSSSVGTDCWEQDPKDVTARRGKGKKKNGQKKVDGKRD